MRITACSLFVVICVAITIIVCVDAVELTIVVEITGIGTLGRHTWIVVGRIELINKAIRICVDISRLKRIDDVITIGIDWAVDVRTNFVTIGSPIVIRIWVTWVRTDGSFDCIGKAVTIQIRVGGRHAVRIQRIGTGVNFVNVAETVTVKVLIGIRCTVVVLIRCGLVAVRVCIQRIGTQDFDFVAVGDTVVVSVCVQVIGATITVGVGAQVAGGAFCAVADAVAIRIA